MTYLDILPNIKTFIFDVDGVLTDGTVQLQSNGNMVRTMNARDGYALQLAVKLGFEVIIITGGSSTAVKERLGGLGIQHIYLKASDKKSVFEEHSLAFNVDPKTALYMGDDIPDYQVMQEVGLACCPNDASPEIKSISSFISTKNGGEGCVREIIEQTLRVQEKWFNPSQEFQKFAW